MLSDVALARSARVARGVARESTTSGPSFSVTIGVSVALGVTTSGAVETGDTTSCSGASSVASLGVGCCAATSRRSRSTLFGRLASGDGVLCSGGAQGASSCSWAMIGSTDADMRGVMASEGPSVDPDEERNRRLPALFKLLIVLAVLADGELLARGLRAAFGELSCPATPATFGGKGVARFHIGEPAETARWRGVTAVAGDRPDALRRGVPLGLGVAALAETERCFGAVGVDGSKAALTNAVAFGVTAPESRGALLERDLTLLDGFSVVSDTLRLMFREDVEGRIVPALLGADGLAGAFGVACSLAIFPGPSAVGVSGDNVDDGETRFARLVATGAGVLGPNDVRGRAALGSGLVSSAIEAVVDAVDARDAALVIDIVRVRVEEVVLVRAFASFGNGGSSEFSAMVA